MIKKATVEETLYDVISEKDYLRNKEIYDRSGGNIAIEHEGFILPIRNSQNDMRPGYYAGGETPRYTMPTSEADVSAYSALNHLIDFSKAKNLRDVIDARTNSNRSERAILTTADNITLPELREDDTPFMKAIKTCILKKQIDLDKYGYRFGNNYPNDKRLLRKPDMTLQKGITYANCLDFDMYLIIRDTSEAVPNPIGETIIVRLTGDRSGFTDEYADQAQQIAEVATAEPAPMAIQEAAYTDYNAHFSQPRGLPDATWYPNYAPFTGRQYYQAPLVQPAGFPQQMIPPAQPQRQFQMYPDSAYETYTTGGKK